MSICTDVPDEFFDEVVEAEKEFCDISMSLIHKRGLEGINSIQVRAIMSVYITWQQRK